MKFTTENLVRGLILAVSLAATSTALAADEGPGGSNYGKVKGYNGTDRAYGPGGRYGDGRGRQDYAPRGRYGYDRGYGQDGRGRGRGGQGYDQGGQGQGQGYGPGGRYGYGQGGQDYGRGGPNYGEGGQGQGPGRGKGPSHQYRYRDGSGRGMRYSE